VHVHLASQAKQFTTSGYNEVELCASTVCPWQDALKHTDSASFMKPSLSFVPRPGSLVLFCLCLHFSYDPYLIVIKNILKI
jgi:hypothetical protein